MHRKRKSAIAAGVVGALILLGCAGPGSSSTAGVGGAGGAGPTTDTTAPRRLITAIAGDPVSVSQRVTRASLAYSVPGGDELERLVHRGLAIADDQSVLQPLLAEAVPTLENGLWSLLPDGTMETTWRIQPNARWHDGTTVTADDFVFTARVVQDKDLTVFRDRNYDFVDGVEAADARTVVVKWKQPFVDADALFNTGPLPRHLLERAYAEDKATFTNLPYWTDDFVGTGPYKLREWARGTHALLEAYHGYVLGRPKIDEVEVRFIPDATTLIANVLSGAVELTLGRAFSIEQALQVRDQWKDGTAEIAPSSWVVIFPQFLNPNPAVVADERFRRALMHALDRQQMADSIQGGLVPLAHAFLGPAERDYHEIQASLVRYDYDPRKATQLVEGLGYARSSDGMLRDASGQKLAVQIWTSGGLDVQVKSMFSVADYWQRIGVSAEPIVVPTQRWNDREYVAAFPAFRLNRQGSTLSFLKNQHSSQTPLPENSFVGQNYSRYRTGEYDTLIDKFFMTVPRQERLQVLGQIVRQMTDQVLLVGLYYDAQPVLISKRLEYVTAYNPGWNAHEWILKGTVTRAS